MYLNRGKGVRLIALLAVLLSPATAYHGIGMAQSGVPAAVGIGGFILLMSGLVAIFGGLALWYL